MTNNGDRQPRRELYRDPDNGKICGVCAGVAEYFGFETWVVRVITVSLLIFLNGGMLIVYFVACWLLAVKPGTVGKKGKFRKKRQYNSDDSNVRPSSRNAGTYRPNVQQVWKRGSAPGQIMKRVQGKMDALECRIRDMEGYVTSEKFALHKEFKNIQD